MKYKLQSLAIITLTFLFANNVNASLADCKDLYVGKIQLAKDVGLQRFTLIEDPLELYGSQWIYVTSWQKEDANTILSTLLSAKLGEKQVTVQTEAQGTGCDIDVTQQLSYILLQSGPS
ncbi:MAG: hypothetical protein KUG79_10215 [Pseudomonadales bacterium]|nr:hypothetical protein [Pseudomonadales bacterium]